MEQIFVYIIIVFALFTLSNELLHKALKNLIPKFDVFPSNKEYKDKNYSPGGPYGPDFKKAAPFKHKVIVVFHRCLSLVISIFATNYLINLIY